MEQLDDVNNIKKRQFFRQMKVADEDFVKALNRQGELSTYDALRLTNVK